VTFTEKLELVLALYEANQPVVLKEKGGRIIHGEETLKTVDIKDCLIIDRIDIDEWERSQWPQILEGARQGWLKNKSRRSRRI